MHAKEGDPILSEDGERVVGYWAKGLHIDGDVINRAVLASWEEAEQWVERGADHLSVPSYSLRVHAVMPDHTYWRIDRSDVPETVILRDGLFRPAPAPVSADPAGMVTAIDQLLRDMPDSGFSQESARLRYMREMYEYRAKRGA